MPISTATPCIPSSGTSTSVDTTLPIDPNKAHIVGLDPYKKQVVYITGVKYENMVKDTLSVFFFHQDTLQKYKWQEIKDKYKILKRYDLSLNDLQNLNFSIPYPPDETMKNMKIYPPYKE